MEPFMRGLIGLNVLAYIVAFGLGYYRNQNLTIYVVFLVIQIIIWFMDVKKVGYTGGGDAAGNGMEAGFLGLMYFGLQMVVMIVLIVTLFKRNL